MKVGLVSDIHGNFDALGAALAAARVHGVEKLLCCGDLVGYYYEPDRCRTCWPSGTCCVSLAIMRTCSPGS